jgi:hypothetical protein
MHGTPQRLTKAYPISAPQCGNCRCPMEHANVMPGMGILGDHIFECPGCGNLQVTPIAEQAGLTWACWSPASQLQRRGGYLSE